MKNENIRALSSSFYNYWQTLMFLGFITVLKSFSKAGAKRVFLGEALVQHFF